MLGPGNVMALTRPSSAGAGSSQPGDNVATVAARARERLIVRPRPDALGVALVAVLPLLQACGLDVFDLGVLRGAVDGSALRFVARIGRDEAATVLVHAVGTPLQRRLERALPADSGFELRTNGPDWELSSHSEEPYPFSLYDDVFPSVLACLFQPGGPDAERRAALARALARTARNGEPGAPPRGAGPSMISARDLALNAGMVANLRGRLRAEFDGAPLPVTSRTALYYVLAATAVQYGREDAVPAEDLVVPPARVGAGLRARPLGRPGWYLLLTREGESLEEATAALLESLGLRRRLQATHRGRAYPSTGDPER